MVEVTRSQVSLLPPISDTHVMCAHIPWVSYSSPWCLRDNIYWSEFQACASQNKSMDQNRSILWFRGQIPCVAIFVPHIIPQLTFQPKTLLHLHPRWTIPMDCIVHRIWSHHLVGVRLPHAGLGNLKVADFDVIGQLPTCLVPRGIWRCPPFDIECMTSL